MAEIDGMLAGLIDGGVDLYSTVLGRNIDATDLRVVNLVVDLAERLYKKRARLFQPVQLGIQHERRP